MDGLFFVNWLALLFSVFVVACILGAIFSKPFKEAVVKVVKRIFRRIPALSLMRLPYNPIIKPGHHPWEGEAVFNPAATILKDRTHLIYRAIGVDGQSRLGYASSKDGLFFDERLPYPVYVSNNPRRIPGYAQRYSPVMYSSGGSWGGCEDPRMVVIDGRVYVSFHVFDGWDFIRVAIISIAEDDFIAKRFHKWTLPTLISPPGQIHKNWVLFPEKLNGKFAIIHSIAPKIDIAYRDSIHEIGTNEPFITSWVGSRRDGPKREGVWDSVVLGSGPPPLRTSHGWLLFYHALEDADPGKYKLGAMLLDINDPTRILARAPAPVLEPNYYYENAGKPGIVYACGATIEGDRLLVYYGGADKVICAAAAHLPTFLDTLLHGEKTELVPEPLQVPK